MNTPRYVLWAMWGVFGIFLMFVAILTLNSCAKPLTPAVEVMYSGPIDGPYKSSPDVTATVLGVQDCMGLTGNSFPPPEIKGLKGGNGVDCGGVVRKGCYVPGFIIVPDQVELEVVGHEAVHHYLLLSTGDLDAEHKSEWFLKCGGGIKVE